MDIKIKGMGLFYYYYLLSIYYIIYSLCLDIGSSPHSFFIPILAPNSSNSLYKVHKFNIKELDIKLNYNLKYFTLKGGALIALVSVVKHVHRSLDIRKYLQELNRKID